MDLLIVSGLSGAGKSVAMNALEDIGFFCIDNIPAAQLPSITAFSKAGDNQLKRVALCMDVRGCRTPEEIEHALDQMDEQGVEYEILFLDAPDEVLMRRYSETRRRHPISELTIAYCAACGRGKRRLPPQETVFTPLVTKPMVSVASRIMHLLRGFYRRGRASLQSIWAANHDRSELVATFKAVLELLKAGLVHLTDDDTELVFAGREKKKAES